MSYLRFASKVRPDVIVESDCGPRRVGTVFADDFTTWDPVDVTTLTPPHGESWYDKDWATENASPLALAVGAGRTGNALRFTAAELGVQSSIWPLADWTDICPNPEEATVPFSARVESGDTVKFSIWVKGTPGSFPTQNCALTIFEYDPNGSLVTVIADPIPDDVQGDWFECSAQMTVSGAGFIQAAAFFGAFVLSTELPMVYEFDDASLVVTP